MPALYGSVNIEKELFYSSYIQTYIQRDVRDLTKVGDETSALPHKCFKKIDKIT
jgi:hypothetical protein